MASAPVTDEKQYEAWGTAEANLELHLLSKLPNTVVILEMHSGPEIRVALCHEPAHEVAASLGGVNGRKVIRVLAMKCFESECQAKHLGEARRALAVAELKRQQ